MHLNLVRTALALPLLCLFPGIPSGASAQEDSASGPPKVLVIQREFLKPGKAGMTHNKSEHAFVQAMSSAHWPTHYIAMDSLSGPSRSNFLFGYPSVAAWGKDNADMQRNHTLAAAIDSASLADGELLSSYESVVLVRRDDLSLNTGKVAKMHFMEFTRFEILPGKEKQWEEAARMYMDGQKKADPKAHWAMYQLVYGLADSSVYLVLSPLETLAEVDQNMDNMKKLSDSIGPEAMKHFEELSAASIKTMQSNLFEMNPRSSYPPEAMVKADPEFWQTK